ncbi:MAG: hypothetical protein ACYDCO_19855 [Armatimonadota bacterium]
MAEKRKLSREQTKRSGEMTVREAGHLGGEKVRDLIEKGEAMEGKQNIKRRSA